MHSQQNITTLVVHVSGSVGVSIFLRCGTTSLGKIWDIFTPEMISLGCLRTSRMNYPVMQDPIPEEQRPQLQWCRSLEPHTATAIAMLPFPF